MNPSYADGIRELFPRAEFEVIAGAGHRVHVDRPERFPDTIEDYLREI